MNLPMISQQMINLRKFVLNDTSRDFQVLNPQQESCQNTHLFLKTFWSFLQTIDPQTGER